MTTRGNVPLPLHIVAVYSVFEGKPLPDAVTTIMGVIGTAIHSHREKPLVVLNRSFGQLRRQHPEIFIDLAAWLALEETQATVNAAGACWAWDEWCHATNKLMAGGIKASVAFGADKPGKPKAKGFSIYHDAAILAEHEAQTKTSTEAETIACNLGNSDNGGLDPRGVQRHRAKVRSTGAPQEDISEQARNVRRKYAKS